MALGLVLGAVYGRVSWSSQAALDRATSYLEQVKPGKPSTNSAQQSEITRRFQRA